MAEIIPSINVRTFEEVQERIKEIEPYVKWCHLDVTDGVFSKHLTWHDPRDLPTLDTKLNIEVHLMMEEPEKLVEQWLIKPVKRIIVHLEATKNSEFIIQKCRAAGTEIGLAINPETFWGQLKPWLGKADIYQVLAVHPGPSGQQIQEDIFDKISHLRQACPKCIIEVDGGINPETAKKAVESGANLLVAGAYIFGNEDVKKALEDLVFMPNLIDKNKLWIGIIILIAAATGGFYFFQQSKLNLEQIKEQEVIQGLDFKKEEVVSEEVVKNDSRTPLPYLQLVSPNGGESLCRGENFIIKWESGGLKTVSVFLKDAKDTYPPKTDNPFAPRPTKLGTFPSSFNERGTQDGDGEFSWKVGYYPSGPFETQVEIGATYEILITGSDEDRSLEDVSDKVFSINFCEG